MTGAAAWDSWSAPAQAYIASVWFDGFYHRTEGDHLFAGITGPSGWRTVYNNYGDIDYDQSSQTPAGTDENTSVLFGVWEDQTVTHPVPGWAAVRGVNILVGDDTRTDIVGNAWIKVNGSDVGTMARDANGTYLMPWVNTSSTVTTGIFGHDLGLGDHEVGIMDMNNNWVGSAWRSGCYGNRAWPCPTQVNYDQAIPLTRGYTDMRVVARDVWDNNGWGVRWRMKVDGDNPKITLSGDAVDHKNDGALGANPTIVVDVKDDSTSSLYGAYDQSGVSIVSVSLDSPTNNIRTWYRPAGCGDDCDAHFQLTLPATTPGEHRLFVTAYDGISRRGIYSEPSSPGKPDNQYFTFNIGAPDNLASYDAMSYDIPPDAADTDPNADQLPVASDAVVAQASTAAPISPTITSFTTSSKDGTTSGGASIAAAPPRDGCTYSRTREGFHILTPQKGFHDDAKHTTSGVLETYKQDRARRISSGPSGGYTSKQWILCGWSGSSTKKGYHLTQSGIAMWLRSSTNLLSQSTWARGVTNGQTSTAMSFQLSGGPLTISSSSTSTGDGSLTGRLGRWGPIEAFADLGTSTGNLREAHLKLDGFQPNMVTAFWTGDSTDYQGTTGEALYEAPQSFTDPQPESINFASAYHR